MRKYINEILFGDGPPSVGNLIGLFIESIAEVVSIPFVKLAEKITDKKREL